MLRCSAGFFAGLIGGIIPFFTLVNSLAAQLVIPSVKTEKYCPAQFQKQVNDYLQRPDLAQAHWGILIQPLDAQTPLFSYQAEKLFIPASTQKLLTTAIALEKLGPNFQFQTPVFAEYAPRRQDQLRTLQVITSGDPSLQPADLNVIAETLKTLGIRHIQQLQVVDPIPPEQYHRPSWEWDDLQYYYAPVVNHAILADNQVTLTLTPQALGEPLQISWSEAIAASQWQVTNRTRTVANPQQPIQIHYNRAKGELILQGKLAPDADGDRTGLAIPDPPRYFLDTLKHQLDQQGITVNYAEITLKSVPVSPKSLLTLKSPPLSALIKTINQNSDNLYAESLFNYLLSAESSPLTNTFWNSHLQTLGIPAAPLRIKDGSGLSRQNLISPQTLVQLLSVLAQSPLGLTYIESLPVAGESGTLKNRFLESPLTGKVQAKTGTLTGVVTLAGFESEVPLGTLVFSLMVNNSDLAASVVREAMDQILLWSAQVEPCDQ
ncbi:MAG: D-alanyl-D-alanine carboxypeptidase/D-alanyl-D-alanine-endopeptidase [Synechocystis sp.]|nr:D-alanyl-D-alanine carboxypeptidase/D-alanyl-D-alanine-endopeptidase [Synechocystis sp.]